MGNTYVEGHEDEILVEAFSHNVTIPRDPQSGQPTGQRVHQPLQITKVFDKCSPMLYNALTSGEKMSKCELHFYRTSTAGQQEHYYTIELEDAIIVELSLHTCLIAWILDKAHYTNMEDVSFSYRKITWRHEVAGTEGSDDWARTKSLMSCYKFSLWLRRLATAARGKAHPLNQTGIPYARASITGPHPPCNEESQSQGDPRPETDDPLGPGAPPTYSQYTAGQCANCR